MNVELDNEVDIPHNHGSSSEAEYPFKIWSMDSNEEPG